MIDIFMTSWRRWDMTQRSIKLLYERTKTQFRLTVYDNGSDKHTISNLFKLYKKGTIHSLILDDRNTGCLYNKIIFDKMALDKYYIVTDNDIYPPLLEPDCLQQLIDLMDKYPSLGLLSPQIQPFTLMQPYGYNDDVVVCKAVGNALKIVRSGIFPNFKQQLNIYGDDGILSAQIKKSGYDVAFCRHIYCYHAGQSKNWGYKKNEILLDPRKGGYGKYFEQKIINDLTYEADKSVNFNNFV